jgi:hypothetical protein
MATDRLALHGREAPQELLPALIEAWRLWRCLCRGLWPLAWFRCMRAGFRNALRMGFPVAMRLGFRGLRLGRDRRLWLGLEPMAGLAGFRRLRFLPRLRF